MPPKRRTRKPRPYGRQDDGKTIKSFSLSTDLAAWAEAEAKKQGISFSAFVEKMLSTERSQHVEPAPQPESRFVLKEIIGPDKPAALSSIKPTEEQKNASKLNEESPAVQRVRGSVATARKRL